MVWESFGITSASHSPELICCVKCSCSHSGWQSNTGPSQLYFPPAQSLSTLWTTFYLLNPFKPHPTAVNILYFQCWHHRGLYFFLFIGLNVLKRLIVAVLLLMLWNLGSLDHPGEMKNTRRSRLYRLMLEEEHVCPV